MEHGQTKQTIENVQGWKISDVNSRIFSVALGGIIETCGGLQVYQAAAFLNIYKSCLYRSILGWDKHRR